LTDIMMPLLSGGDLAVYLKNAFPHFKFLFMSGYSREELLEKGFNPEGRHFIEKPFTYTKLFTKVEEVLGED